jgi:hypothetical protein
LLRQHAPRALERHESHIANAVQQGVTTPKLKCAWRAAVMPLSEFFSEQFWLVVCLIGLAFGLTFAIFHWRKFDEGYEQGEAADPDKIAHDNPPDEWCKSHWVEPVAKPKLADRIRLALRH